MNDNTDINMLALEALSADPVYLDTETTGLDEMAEMCEIAILDSDGSPLLHTLVKPKNRIPWDAERIHGISNEDVANAPTWPEIRDDVYKILTARKLAIYNAEYDLRIIQQCDQLYGLSPNHVQNWICVMELYAQYFGEWNERRGNYKWQKLTTAAAHTKYIYTDRNAHRADEDCRMTRHVLHFLSKTKLNF